MKRNVITVIEILVLALGVLAQDLDMVQSLNNNDWNIREKAFRKILEDKAVKQYGEELTRLLERENVDVIKDEIAAQQQPKWIPKGEKYSAYYADLVQAVTALGTLGAAIALAHSPGGGKVVSDVLIRWPIAVREILLNQMLSSEAIVLRINAATYLVAILDNIAARQAITNSDVAEVMRGFETIMGDKVPVIRACGIRACAKLNYIEALPTISRIATEDKDASVRATASKAIEELSKVKK